MKNFINLQIVYRFIENYKELQTFNSSRMYQVIDTRCNYKTSSSTVNMVNEHKRGKLSDQCKELISKNQDLRVLEWNEKWYSENVIKRLHEDEENPSKDVHRSNQMLQ